MKRNKGFTLIELMITVVVVGILATIAIPSYNGYVIKTNRTEGKALLMEVMQKEEKYYNERNNYTTTLTQLGYSASPIISEKGYYSVAAAVASTTDNIILQATPIGNQATDSDCGILILSSNGQKTTSTNNSKCWQ